MEVEVRWGLRAILILSCLCTRLTWTTHISLGKKCRNFSLFGPLPLPSVKHSHNASRFNEFHVTSEAKQHKICCRLSLSAALTDVDQVDFETYLSQSEMLTMSLVKLNGMTA